MWLGIHRSTSKTSLPFRNFPIARDSFVRIATLIGSRYESALVSNQMDVFQLEPPMVTVAFNLPHPSSEV